MNVTINITSDTQPTELSAVIAFCLALGGTANTIEVSGRPIEAIAPPAPPRPANPIADALLEQHAASVAARTAPPPPPPATDNDDDGGEAVDPAKLDVDGIPWDARIHSERPTINKDKTWRKKRGVDEVYYGQIHGELQALHSAPNGGTGTTSAPPVANGSDIAPTPPAPPPPVSSAPTASAPPPPPVDVPNGPTPTVAPPAPTAEAPVVATPAESASGGGRFPDFPSFVQAVSAIRSPSYTYLELNRFAESVAGAGVGFKDMRDRAGLWDLFYDMAGGQ